MNAEGSAKGMAAEKMSPEERKSKLARALAYAVTQGGTLESQAEYLYVVRYGEERRVNHVLHLLLTILTGGFWILVWGLLILTNKRPPRDMITIDDYGNLRFQDVRPQR